MNLKLMVTKIYSPIFLKFEIKFNLNHFYISRKTLANVKSVEIKVSEYLGYWSRDSDIMISLILGGLLILACCRMNTPNYRHNDGFMESSSRV